MCELGNAFVLDHTQATEVRLIVKINSYIIVPYGSMKVMKVKNMGINHIIYWPNENIQGSSTLICASAAKFPTAKGCIL